MMFGVKNVWTLMDKLKLSPHLRKGKGLLDDVTEQMDVLLVQMQKIEGESPVRQAENLAIIKELLLFGLPINIVMAVGLAFYFNRDTVSRLTIVMEHARSLTEGKALGERSNGNDEIAVLNRAFLVMAKNLDELARKEKALLSNAALSNALKYSPRKSKAEVEIDEKDGYVELKVIDHGIGIALENQYTVIERFKLIKELDKKTAQLRTRACGFQRHRRTAQRHHWRDKHPGRRKHLFSPPLVPSYRGFPASNDSGSMLTAPGLS